MRSKAMSRLVPLNDDGAFHNCIYPIHCAVDVEQVYQIAPKRVFTGEADLKSLTLDKLHHLDSLLRDVGHVFSVRKLSKNRRRADNNVESVHT
jgi:hypothetical protein